MANQTYPCPSIVIVIKTEKHLKGKDVKRKQKNWREITQISSLFFFVYCFCEKNEENKSKNVKKKPIIKKIIIKKKSRDCDRLK